MKFAFSTVACPKWDFETVCARAKEYGYDGVEIRGFLNESVLTASNVFLSDPAKIRATFDRAGVAIACLASSIAMSGSKKHDRVAADDCRRFIDTADAVGCRMVKVFDSYVAPGHPLNPATYVGHSRAATAVALGDWLLPLGDYAAQRDVVLLVENALSFRTSKELWLILDRLQHPSIACCWDVFNAALIGEGPWVSVPTLNSKIQYTQVKDAKLGALGASYTKLGDGDVKVQSFLTRLKGIGYEGWVTLEWEKAWLPGIAEPEEILPDSIKKLREWSKPQIDPNGDAKAKAAHAPKANKPATPGTPAAAAAREPASAAAK